MPRVPVEVRPARSRRDLTRFIKLPWRLYSNAPQWVPPLVSERRRHLSRKRNPFFEHAEAEYLIAWRDGRPVGRISAHVDHRLNEVQQNRWGLFSFFECEDDHEAAEALLRAAEDWLAERGRDRIVGPLDFSTNHEVGLLVEGHERRPQILEGWHHRYYPGLLDRAGYGKAMDVLKWELHISDREKVLPVIWELAERLQPDHGIVMRHMRRREFGREVERFMSVYNAAWERNWGFVPLTAAELHHLAKELRPLISENWALIAERDGDTIGAALTLPDFNEVLARLNGRLLPLGWLKALWWRDDITRVRVHALGVRPEYQHTGVAAAFYAEHFRMASITRQTGGEMGWILETNTPMNRAMEAMGGRVVKRYRLYERALRGAE